MTVAPLGCLLYGNGVPRAGKQGYGRGYRVLRFRKESIQRKIVLSELCPVAPALTQYCLYTDPKPIHLPHSHRFLALSTIQTSEMPAERVAVLHVVYFPNSVTARLTGAAAGRKRKLLRLETCWRKSPFAMPNAGREHKRYVIYVVSRTMASPDIGCTRLETQG